jgi:intracellular septation protein A
MNVGYLLVSFLPLILYVACDAIWGLRAGLKAALVAVAVLCGYEWWAFGELNQLIIIEASLIFGLGLVSLAFNNSAYFKFQPVVVGVLFAAIMLWFQLFDEPFMLKLLPMFGKLMPANRATFALPEFRENLIQLSIWLPFVLVLHAGLVAWSAIRLSNTGWLLMRLAIFPLGFLLGIVVSVV